MFYAFSARAKAVVSVLLLGGLTACGPTAATGVPGVAQIDILSVVGTDKSIVDHVVSYSSGKDCSYVYVEKGNRYCKEDEPIIKPQVFCYKSIGRATCYEQPDPHNNGSRETGNNDHNMVTSHKSR
jgi:hypothetical protein